MPGPDEEIKVVREIYSRYTDARQSCETIVDALNGRGLVTEHGGRWSRSIVYNILTNPKYIGCNMFNRKSFKLNKAHVSNPAHMWVRRNNAFAPLISAETFQKAHGMFATRRRHYSDEDLLELLRGLWKAVGYLSNKLIERTAGMPSRAMYHERFHGIRHAYELIGYMPERDSSFVDVNKRLQAHRQEYLATLIADLVTVGATVRTGTKSGLLTINDEFTVQYMLIRCRETKLRGYRWQFRLDRALRPDITIAARMVPGNESVLDYYLLPELDFSDELIDLTVENSFLLDVYQFKDLSFLMDLARRSQLKDVI